MKAIMLAAGEGTRCYPFTFLSPKIAQQVCGIPLLEYMLSWFSGTPEIEKLYIVARNDSTVKTLRNYLQNRKPYLNEVVDLFRRLGFKLEYVNPDFESEVIQARGWGTGGDLRLALNQITSIDKFEEDFLVCYGDYIITRRLPAGELSPQLDLPGIISYHRNCKRALNTVMTVALTVVAKETATRFGVAQLEQVKGFNLVRSFVEKPDVTDIPEKPTINAGVYVIDRDFILSDIDEFLPEKPNTDLAKTLLERLAKENKPRLAAYLLDLCAWFDIGTLEQLIDANLYVASQRG
ncbi:NDP-sugar synthase [Chloroflexota bacterium]